MLADLRFGLRQLVRQPGFAAVAILTLALGIGANTAIFSLVKGVLVSPLPLADANRLVRVAARSDAGFDISVSIPNYYSWEEQNRVFESFSARRGTTFNLTDGDRPERVVGGQVLGDFFGVSGRLPIVGRTIQPDETRRGAERLAVISHGLWQRRYGSDLGVIGQTIRLNGDPFTVIGVMPADFFVSPGTDVWVPIGVDESLPWESRGNSPGLYALGRLKPGITLEQARVDMERVGASIRATTDWRGTPTVTPLREVFVGELEPAILVLFGAVGFVLLIACVNLANLMLARGESRQREVAVRSALGAGRLRLVRQLLTESVLLAVLGGALGVVLAAWGLDSLKAGLPLGDIILARIAIEAPVLWFTLVVSVGTGLLFGLVPAIQTARVALGESLKEGGRSPGATTGGRFRNALVVGEIALALVLLVGAGLMIRSFSQIEAVDPGFDTDGIVTMRIALPDGEYPDSRSWYRYFQQLLLRVEQLPGVVNAAVNNAIPLASGGTESSALPDSRPIERQAFASCLYQAVSPDYFATMGIPLRRGRAFSDRDVDPAPPVAIVDETLAQEFWPGENPIGRRVAFEFTGSGPDDAEPLWREVVGVVGHVRHYEIRTPSRIQIYVPYTQPPMWFANRRRPLALFVKAEGDPTTVVPAVRAEVGALDANLPVYDVMTMDDVLIREVGTERLLSGVLLTFATVALLLATIGIYGVMAYTVSRRTHEFGVRMALGAQFDDVMRLVMRRAVRLTASGVAVGVAAAALMSRVLTTVLYEVSATDPVIFGVIPVVMTAVAAFASYVPARRATKVDPVVALRVE